MNLLANVWSSEAPQIKSSSVSLSQVSFYLRFYAKNQKLSVATLHLGLQYFGFAIEAMCDLQKYITRAREETFFVHKPQML